MDKNLLLKDIEELRELKDNWDSYGAKSINDIVCDNSKWIINVLPDNLDIPNIVPCSNGNIQMEWQLNGKELEIEIGEEIIEYLKVFNNKADDMIEGQFEFLKSDNTKKEIDKLINWFLR